MSSNYVWKNNRTENDEDQVSTKKVLLYGWDPDSLLKRRMKVGSSGELDATLSSVTETNPHTTKDEIRVFQENHICTDNTTTTLLAGGETFTGGWQDCLNYQEVNVSIVASHNSATNGLVFQWSVDGVSVGDTDTFSYYTASGGTNYTPNPSFRYVRVLYTNGPTPQTSFSLQTILRRGMTGGSFHRIDSTLKDDADARLNITVPKLKTAANTYVSQTATTAGNAKVSLEEVNGYEPTQYEGGEVTVGLTAVEITFTAQTKSINLQADQDNTGSIWIGKSTVTASANRMARLDAGDSASITLNDTSDPLYAISATASQKLYKIALVQ